MTTIERMTGLLDKLQDKEYRDAYVFEHISTGIPFQIKALRKARGWNQARLAAKAGKQQGQISEIESEDEGRFQLRTLMELASAFDVALLLKFVPYSKFLEETADVSQQGLEADSFLQELSKLRNAKPLAEIREKATIGFYRDSSEIAEIPFSTDTHDGAQVFSIERRTKHGKGKKANLNESSILASGGRDKGFAKTAA